MDEVLQKLTENGRVEAQSPKSTPKIMADRDLSGSEQSGQNPDAPNQAQEQIMGEQLERRQTDRRHDDRRHLEMSGQQAPNEGEATDPCEAQNADARIADRHKVLKTAKIEIDLNFADIPCVVRNISDTGAMLNITGDHLMPERFILHVPMDGFAVDCQIVRRDGANYGVKFIGEKRELARKKVQYIRPASDWATKVSSLDYAADDQPDQAPSSSTNIRPRHKHNKAGFGRRGS